MLSIRTSGSVWAKLIEQQNANAKKPEGRGDAFVFFVGARGSGKSTLLNRFLFPDRVEVPKPSEGLEYTYARKPSNFDHEKKDLAHIWEIGGSQEFAEEIMKADQLFLTAKQVTTAVVVLVVDLSDPNTMLSSLLTWLDLIKNKLTGTYEKFEKKGLQLPEQLRQRAKNKLFTSNEDKDLVYHSGISLVIAATKYDTLRDKDPEVKKVIARTLRYIAHAHGAFLMYMSNLHSLGVTSLEQSSGKESATDKTLLANFKNLLNHLIFQGLEKKPSLKLAPQLDHAGPLMIPAGMDKFRDIGRPRGVMDGNVTGGLQEWKELYDKMFPPKQATKAAKFTIDEIYAEEEVDLAFKRKMDELEAYLREQEAAKEAAKKKLAAMKNKSDAPKEGGSSSSKKSGSSRAKESSSKKSSVEAATVPDMSESSRSKSSGRSKDKDRVDEAGTDEREHRSKDKESSSRDKDRSEREKDSSNKSSKDREASSSDKPRDKPSSKSAAAADGVASSSAKDEERRERRERKEREQREKEGRERDKDRSKDEPSSRSRSGFTDEQAGELKTRPARSSSKVLDGEQMSSDSPARSRGDKIKAVQ